MIKVKGKKLCENCFTEIGGEPCYKCGFSKRTYTPANGVLPVGSVLSKRYIIGGVIGQGGFGITYHAYDKTNNKILAIKEYYPSSIVVRNTDKLTVSVSSERNEDIFRKGIKEFYDEAGLVSKFNGNPNIVSIYDCFYENDTAYIVMEMINGETLKAYVKKNGTLSSAQALYVFSEMANALMICHSTDLLHRDISPDNIMLCENGRLKLIDFGAAREVVDDDPKSLSVILKNGFAPLEQYQKHGKQGPWTDIYSLGATVYHLLTNETLDDPMTRLENDGELENKYGIDEELWEIIVRSVKLKISDRYQNAIELKNAIKAVSYKPVHIKETKFDSEEKINADKPYQEINKPVQHNSKIIENEKQKIDESLSHNESNENKDSLPINATKPIIADNPAVNNDIIAHRIDDSAKADFEDKKQNAEDDNVKPKKNKKHRKIKIAGIAAGIVGIVVVGAVVIANVGLFEASSKITIGGIKYSKDDTIVTIPKKADLRNIDLNKLKNMGNLKRLTLDGNNKLTDLDRLSGLTNLTYLSINNCNVTDLSFVKNMKNLEELRANNNKISDISALEKLKKLKKLELRNNSINDVSPLANGQEFDRLDLRDNSYGEDKEAYIYSFYGITMAKSGNFNIEEQNPRFTKYDDADIFYNLAWDGSFDGSYNSDNITK